MMEICDKTQLIYLASPYNHVDPLVREQRYELTAFVTCTLLHLGLVVFSPIVHNHPLVKLNDLGRSWEKWIKQDQTILARCDEIWVLKIEGWRESRGVRAEITFAQDVNMNVKQILLNDNKDLTIQDWSEA